LPKIREIWPSTIPAVILHDHPRFVVAVVTCTLMSGVFPLRQASERADRPLTAVTNAWRIEAEQMRF
jgi:hypothetical protein